MNKNNSKTNSRTYQMTLLVGLPESSGGRVRSFPLSTSFHHSFPWSYTTWGKNKRPVGDRSSETQSHPIDMKMIIIIIMCNTCFRFPRHY
jgi:hypothetical protein